MIKNYLIFIQTLCKTYLIMCVCTSLHAGKPTILTPTKQISHFDHKLVTLLHKHRSPWAHSFENALTKDFTICEQLMVTETLSFVEMVQQLVEKKAIRAREKLFKKIHLSSEKKEWFERTHKEHITLLQQPKKNNVSYTLSHQTSEQTIYDLETILKIYGIFPEITVFDKSVRTACVNKQNDKSCDRRYYIGLGEKFWQLKQHSKFFVLGHELAHIYHGDAQERYMIYNLCPGKTNEEPDYYFWQELRADTRAALINQQSLIGYIEFALANVILHLNKKNNPLLSYEFVRMDNGAGHISPIYRYVYATLLAWMTLKKLPKF